MNSTTLKIDFCEKLFFGSYGPIYDIGENYGNSNYHFCKQRVWDS